jgi:hypothetical protein
MDAEGKLGRAGINGKAGSAGTCICGICGSAGIAGNDDALATPAITATPTLAHTTAVPARKTHLNAPFLTVLITAPPV